MVDWIAYEKQLSTILKSKKKVLLIVGLLIFASLAVVAAAYTMTSNHVSVTVTSPTPSPSPSPTPPPEATLALTVNDNNIVSGETVVLTATSSDHSNGLVNFLNNGASVGTAQTSNGVASISFTLTVPGVYDFSATMPHN